MNPLSISDRWILGIGCICWVFLYEFFEVCLRSANPTLTPFPIPAWFVYFILVSPGVMAFVLGLSSKRMSVGWLVGTMYGMTTLVWVIIRSWWHPEAANFHVMRMREMILTIAMIVIAGIFGMIGGWRGQARSRLP